MSDASANEAETVVVPRAWIAMAFDGQNQEYDKLGEYYGFDSNVQNHKQVSIGDLLFIRSKTALQGVGKIARIAISSAEKEVARCPICSVRVVLKRDSRTRMYKCRKGHISNDVTIATVPITMFRAVFDDYWIPVNNAITAVELRRFYLKKSFQLALNPAHLEGLLSYLTGWLAPEVGATLRTWGRVRQNLGALEAEEGPDLTPEGEDRRAAVMALIRRRRGQREFRDALLRKYERRCAITGCVVLDVLEAAHIRPYRGASDNHSSNGLLLRSDIHTLFDLDLLGINPTDGKVTIHPSLLGTEYERFHDLQIAPRLVPDIKALQVRWASFQEGYKTTKEAEESHSLARK